MVGVDGCRKIVPGCQQERKPNSGMPVNVYSTANVLFGKHLSYIETVLVLSKGNKINRRMSGTLKNDMLRNSNTKLQWVESYTCVHER